MTVLAFLMGVGFTVAGVLILANSEDRWDAGAGVMVALCGLLSIVLWTGQVLEPQSASGSVQSGTSSLIPAHSAAPSPAESERTPTPRPSVNVRPTTEPARATPKASARASLPPKKPVSSRSVRPSVAPASISGLASWYAGTPKFVGTPHVALAYRLGGRFTGHISRHVRVCVKGGLCKVFPVVDSCGCPSGRIVDLSLAALGKLKLSTGPGIYRVSMELLP